MIEQSASSIIDHIRERFYDQLDEKILDLYVCPLGKENDWLDVKPFDLVDQIIESFLQDPSKKNLLLLGGSGLGKSTLGLYLTDFLWKHQEEFSIVPLFIHLPTIPKEFRTEELLKYFLKNSRGLALNKKERNALFRSSRLLLILDGYDEIPNPGNLHFSNRWDEFESLQVITTCRPEALELGYVKDFYPLQGGPNSFLQYRIEAFDLEQMWRYCQQYISRREKEEIDLKRPFFTKAKDYLRPIRKISGLKELCQTPFILSMLVEVLPSVLKKIEQDATHPLTRARLYDHFTKHWFKRQAIRLQKQYRFKELGFKAPTKELAIYLRIYSENLASKVLKQGRLEVIIEDHPEKPITLDKDLLYPRRISDIHALPDLENDRELLQETEDNAGMKWIRSGCLLKTQNDATFSFLHKSLVEYFAANDLFNSVFNFECGDYIDLSQEELRLDQEQFIRLRRFSLNSQLIVREPGILRVLAERVQDDEEYEVFLRELIEQSKAFQGHLIETAAANAITILNWAGVEFAGQDLSGIRIPGANLSQNLLEGTDLSYANLRQVNFSQAGLHNAILSAAYLQGAQLGEHPYIKKSSEPTCCVYSPDGRFLAVGDERGYVVVYDAESQAKQASLTVGIEPDLTFFMPPKSLREQKYNMVFTLAFSPKNSEGNCEELAVGSADGIIRIYCTRRWREKKRLKGHKDSVVDVAYDPTGSKIISTSSDRTIREWQVETKECIQLFSEYDNEVPLSAVYNPTGSKVVSLGRIKPKGDSVKAKTVVREWDVETGEYTQLLSMEAGYFTAAYNPTVSKIAFGGVSRRYTQEWDLSTGECLHRSCSEYRGPVVGISYDPTGSKIVFGEIEAYRYAKNYSVREPKSRFRKNHSEN